jgi:hypothetical protein
LENRIGRYQHIVAQSSVCQLENFESRVSCIFSFSRSKKFICENMRDFSNIIFSKSSGLKIKFIFFGCCRPDKNVKIWFFFMFGRGLGPTEHPANSVRTWRLGSVTSRRDYKRRQLSDVLVSPKKKITKNWWKIELK